MSLRTYLKSNLVTLGILLLAEMLLVCVLGAASVNRFVTVLVVCIVLVGGLTAIAVDYLRKRPFYQSLASVLEGDAEPQWLTELVERPEFAEGALAYDACRAVAKKAGDEVAAANRQLVEYREYIETWVHEAKSPLAATHLMLANLEETAGETLGYERLERIGDELRRVEGYIEQALFYARSEAVDRDYLIRAYCLHDLVNAAIRAHAPTLIAARMMPVTEGLDIEVFTDEKWIEFVLGQLIQNSVKYACDDQATISFVGRLVDKGLSSEAVELTVADNGCGVSEADLPRVFEKGFTGDNGRTGKRSTGIGLYLVKRLCDKMGVRIRAASAPGSGFTVVLSFSTNKFQYFE